MLKKLILALAIMAVFAGPSLAQSVPQKLQSGSGSMLVDGYVLTAPEWTAASAGKQDVLLPGSIAKVNAGTNVNAALASPLIGMFHNGAGVVGLHGGGSSGYVQLYNNGGTYNTLSCQTLGTTSNGQVMCSAPGAVPTNSGSCAINAQVGGSFAGSFKANGACSSGTLLFTFPISQANGYACTIQDLSTTSDTMKQSGSATNQASFVGSMASGDILVYQCVGF